LSQPTEGTTAPSLSAFDAMATATNTKNPVMLAKLVARKVILLLTSDEESDPSTPVGYILALLKDVILGLVFGVLTISFFIVLDHRNIIHFQSAHNVREAAYSALSDPVTLASLEAEIDMKFMTVADYEAAKKEIDDVETTLTQMAEKLEERGKEMEQLAKDLEALVEEKATLMKNPKLASVDQFCGSCKWGPTTCSARVEYLMGTYNNPKLLAMLNLMDQGKCKN